jgi:phosphoribosylformylglycinamidine cyclo-ligase
MGKEVTYADSGVDIDKEERAIKGLLSSIKSQRSGIGRPLGGHYAGMIEFGDYALVLCTDGVGSKVCIADALKKWDTVGIDCIAMNVNDAICVGAEPLAFVDYLAIDDPNPKITKEIGKGLQNGANLANMSIIGGETASLPDLINGFDLAGTCLAYVKKENIITGSSIESGDVIIGLGSSGIHSNGYTLVRHVLKKANLNYHDAFPDGSYVGHSIGEILLRPTRIYVKEILELIKNIPVHGLAHITGGGLRNLLRLNSKVRYTITNPITPQPLFDFIQKTGYITLKEMYQTFNMGMGFSVILSESVLEDALDILKKHTSSHIQIVGKITEGSGVIVPSLDIKY